MNFLMKLHYCWWVKLNAYYLNKIQPKAEGLKTLHVTIPLWFTRGIKKDETLFSTTHTTTPLWYVDAAFSTSSFISLYPIFTIKTMQQLHVDVDYDIKVKVNRRTGNLIRQNQDGETLHYSITR